MSYMWYVLCMNGGHCIDVFCPVGYIDFGAMVSFKDNIRDRMVTIFMP